MPFLDKFKDAKVGQTPLTFVLSLRSSFFRAVFLQFYMIPLLGLIYVLLNSRQLKVLLVLISSISF